MQGVRYRGDGVHCGDSHCGDKFHNKGDGGFAIDVMFSPTAMSRHRTVRHNIEGFFSSSISGAVQTSTWNIGEGIKPIEGKDSYIFGLAKSGCLPNFWHGIPLLFPDFF